MSGYFNFYSHLADDWWARRAFLHTWWRANRRDPRWLPPLYAPNVRALVQSASPHVQRLRPTLLTMDAVARQSRIAGFAGLPVATSADDSVVGMVALLHDDRPDLPTTWLSLLNFANDEEALERLLGAVWEHAAVQGSVRIAGPVSLTPSFAPGVLLDNYHLDPPSHTPYTAPYLPELLDGTLEPLGWSRIYSLDLHHMQAAPPDSGLRIESLDPTRLAADLLPLAQLALGDGIAAAPDALEMEFLLASLSVAPLLGWSAMGSGRDDVAGFVLVQPDVGARLRITNGGRNPWGRARVALRTPTVERGRLLLGAVAMEARGNGVAAVLLATAASFGRTQGWKTLEIGPVTEGSDAESVLQAAGAVPRQRYALFGSAE